MDYTVIFVIVFFRSSKFMIARMMKSKGDSDYRMEREAVLRFLLTFADE